MTSRELDKALAFMRTLDERRATRIVDLGWGRAVFNDPLPLVWDLNFVAIQHSTVLGADEIAVAVDDVQGGAGLKHRKLWVEDEREGDRLSPNFVQMGWEPGRLVTMVKKHDTSPLDTAEVNEAFWGEMEPAVRQALRESESDTGPEVAEQLVQYHHVTREVTNMRYFALRRDGIVVASCEVYSDGSVAQIEDVATLTEYRARGFASRVVHKATEIAQNEGHDVVFLIADLDDGPTKLYERLGYEKAGVSYQFVKKPD